jgi:nitrate reductase gamma subunit
MNALHAFAYGTYPYICLTVFLVGSLIRFDRDQYTWKSDSSQLLRARQLRWGSNLFHVGVLFLFFGHLFGLLTPTAVYTVFISVPTKQMMAIVSGGIAGLLCFIGLSLLLHRRLFDDRVRMSSRAMDTGILLILWVQLVIGLVTLPYSLSHSDGSVMLQLSHWAQAIITFEAGAAAHIAGLAWPYQIHLILGMTIFLLFPFTRLVHVWSGFASVSYLVRPRQLVRRRT